MSAQTMFREDELVVRRQKVNGEWIETPYPKLGGRLRVLHEQNQAEEDNLQMAFEAISSIETENLRLMNSI